MGISEGLKRGTIEIMILNLLKEEDMYGYQLCQELEKRSRGLYVLQEGSLYPTLYRLLEKQFISDKTEKVGKRRTRVYYHIEPNGMKYLEQITKEYISLNQGVFFALGYKDLKEFLDEKER